MSERRTTIRGLSGVLAYACTVLVCGIGCVGEMGPPPFLDDGDGSEPPPPTSDDIGHDPDGPVVGPEDCTDNTDNNGDGLVDCLDPTCDCDEEVCTDNVDNDGDGLVDCADPQCSCQEEDCVDNVDNDGDGLPDCLDPQCDCDIEDCEDNVDNDGDGLADCLDPECGCSPEDCTNNVDDDGDGLTDCHDPACDCLIETCDDNLDYDGDGLIDCFDPECGCSPVECTDGVDDDGDGWVDCLDPECDCIPEICDNNVDDDLDGLVDCVDSDCDCPPEVCFDGVDNDGDGLIDCTATPDPECPCDIFAEGCRSSGRIAFLNCNNGATATVVPADYDVFTFTCPDVLAAPHLLNGFDTVVFYGGGGRGLPGMGVDRIGYDYNEMVSFLNLLYNAGAKVIIAANVDMGYQPFGDISTHYHANQVARSTVTVTSSNTMTEAFVREEQMGMHLVQLHSDSPDWCGDLFFEEPGFNGHCHGFRRDSDAVRGLIIYAGVYDPTRYVHDFGNRHLAANLDQEWNPGWGTSDICGLTCDRPVGHGVGKPVIYLYPEEETRVTVELDFEGQLITTYPTIDEELGGWDVVAYPDGTLYDTRDGHEYSYIYWNGISSAFTPNFESGFVVRGEDTVEFLQSTLSEMGMLPYEYNELIVYWLPYMEHHAYNLIHFAAEEYTDIARMRITPEPDSLLRVFMVFQELDEPIDIPEQTFEPFLREGFTVVEWGGSEIGGDWRVVR